MKMFKKILAVVLAAMFAALMLAGCSSSSDAETAEDTSDTQNYNVAILQYMPHSSLDNCTQGVENILDEKDITYTLQIGSSGSADADCQSYAEQMVASGVDLIIAVATPAATAAYSAVQNASADIPVIFCAVSDPVAAGLVESMEEPGNNTTGTADAFDIDGQVDLIMQLQPDLQNLGVIYTTSESNSISQLETLQEKCDAVGINLISQGISEASELASATATLLPQVDAVTNLTDNNVVDNMSVLLEQASDAKIPVYGSEIEQVKKGCIASASIDYVALGEVTGNMAVDVLNGADAATYSAVQVTDSFLVANSDVMETLGIELPESLEDIEIVTTESEE